MKKAAKWLRRILVSLLVTVGLATFSGLLLGMICFRVFMSEYDLRKEPAEKALINVGLTAYAKHAPADPLTIGNSLTAFIIPKYDNHVDNTDLHAGIMACAASTPGWRMETITADAYTAMLGEHLPGTGFLCPADVSFDAHYQAGNVLAFFDPDTGLFIYYASDS